MVSCHPRTTEQNSTMTSIHTEGQEPDIYGQVHPEETQELISTKLREFREYLSQINDKDALSQAEQKCPNQLTEGFQLMFLRAEVFNVDLAAKRYVNYWERRLAIFGPDKAFLKITQKQALRDDTVALSIGFMRDMGVQDPSGRAIIFVDPSLQDKSKYTRESMARAVFYTVQTILVRNENAQKHGVVFVLYPHHAKFSQFDRKLGALNMSILKVKLLLGDRLRKRVLVHAGKPEHVQQRLAEYGLTKDHLVSDLGGSIVLDHEKWLADRRSEEESS